VTEKVGLSPGKYQKFDARHDFPVHKITIAMQIFLITYAIHTG